MKQLVTAMLVVAAIIHLLPLPGVLGTRKLERLYGVPIVDQNLAILMRHRAVLFGLLGSFMLAAAFCERLQPAAFTLGFASVISFLWLCRPAAGCNAQLRRVVLADWIALASLVVGAIAALVSRSA